MSQEWFYKTEATQKNGRKVQHGDDDDGDEGDDDGDDDDDDLHHPVLIMISRQAHNPPVYNIQWNTFIPNIFITCASGGIMVMMIVIVTMMMVMVMMIMVTKPT